MSDDKKKNREAAKKENTGLEKLGQLDFSIGEDKLSIHTLVSHKDSSNASKSVSPPLKPLLVWKLKGKMTMNGRGLSHTKKRERNMCW